MAAPPIDVHLHVAQGGQPCFLDEAVELGRGGGTVVLPGDPPEMLDRHRVDDPGDDPTLTRRHAPLRLDAPTHLARPGTGGGRLGLPET